jgi:hypothetical protein
MSTTRCSRLTRSVRWTRPRTINADSLEARLVRTFPPDYLLNRIGGGSLTGLRGLFISAEMKRRRLMPGLREQDPDG